MIATERPTPFISFSGALCAQVPDTRPNATSWRTVTYLVSSEGFMHFFGAERTGRRCIGLFVAVLANAAAGLLAWTFRGIRDSTCFCFCFSQSEALVATGTNKARRREITVPSGPCRRLYISRISFKGFRSGWGPVGVGAGCQAAAGCSEAELWYSLLYEESILYSSEGTAFPPPLNAYTYK